MSAESIQQNNTLIVVNVGSVQLRFLILTAPSPSNLSLYIKDLKRHGVRSLVRVCAPTYKEEVVTSHGIKVYDGQGWFFEDGAPPPKDVLTNWLNLLEKEFGLNEISKEKQPELTPQGPVLAPVPSDKLPCVGVHCIAGLGRAPVLVAVSLIELAGLQAADAVYHIRESRHGCFNQDQLKWLLKYKRTRKPYGNSSGCCDVQ
ncbi:putative protein tyrosine phosphatase type IVA A [Diplonema papillatum]|nr:putative protein tyrosine phosphatase type IVA A [Diplonema papillatum]